MVCLKRFLVVLDELEQEPCEEDYLKEYAEEQSLTLVRLAAPVHQPRYNKRYNAVQHLIDLRGVAGHRFTVAHEDKAPWQVRRATINLGVHQVAEANESGCDTHAHYESVHNPQE